MCLGAGHGRIAGVSPSQHDTPSIAEPAQQPASAESTHRRIRYTPTALVPLAIGAIAAFPFAGSLGPWGLLFAVPFILGAIWVLRVGMDIEPDFVRVRGALASLKIPRAELTGFVIDKRHVHLVRTNGATVRIPTVRPRDLPMLRKTLFPGDAPTAADSGT